MLEDTKAALQDLDKVTVLFRPLENECLVASEHLLLLNINFEYYLTDNSLPTVPVWSILRTCFLVVFVYKVW